MGGWFDAFHGEEPRFRTKRAYSKKRANYLKKRWKSTWPNDKVRVVKLKKGRYKVYVTQFRG